MNIEVSSFGAWLRTMRMRAGVTQLKVAAELGVQSSSVSNWEYNKFLPHLTPMQMESYCNILTVDLFAMSRAQKVYGGKS